MKNTFVRFWNYIEGINGLLLIIYLKIIKRIFHWKVCQNGWGMIIIICPVISAMCSIWHSPTLLIFTDLKPQLSFWIIQMPVSQKLLSKAVFKAYVLSTAFLKKIWICLRHNTEKHFLNNTKYIRPRHILCRCLQYGRYNPIFESSYYEKHEYRKKETVGLYQPKK